MGSDVVNDAVELGEAPDPSERANLVSTAITDREDFVIDRTYRPSARDVRVKAPPVEASSGRSGTANRG